MKNKPVLFALIMVIACLIGGCGNNTPDKPSATGQAETLQVIDLKQVETIGNNSYIIVDKPESPMLHRRLILQLLNQFENANPGLEITFWAIEKAQAARGSAGWVYGIWVHNRPRQK